MYSAVTNQGDKLLIVAHQNNQEPRRQNNLEPRNSLTLNYSFVECNLRNKDDFLDILAHVNGDQRPIQRNSNQTCQN